MPNEQPREGTRTHAVPRWTENSVANLAADEPAQSQPREGEAARVETDEEYAAYLREYAQTPEADIYLPRKRREPAPEQPTREARVDLAERLEARATSADQNLSQQNPEDKAYYNGIATAFRIAAQLARASAHPEQSARVDCVCGDPFKPYVVHRTDGPCYHYEPAPTEEGGDR